jgi:hypothetical protein
MVRDLQSPGSQEIRIDALAAELAADAYRVALRTRGGENWLDLELDLWRTMAAKLKAVKCL